MQTLVKETHIWLSVPVLEFPAIGQPKDRRMRFILRYFLPGLAGLLVGPLLMLVVFVSATAITIEGWTSNWDIGSSQANPYLRTYVAVYGLLALSKEEAVYFNRSTDDAGDPLSEACDYAVTGTDLPAAWWSLTLYDKRGYLPENTDQALSFDATQAGQGGWRVLLSATRPAEAAHWISSHKSETFDLTLRLYKPSEALLAQPSVHLRPPSITKLQCTGV